MEGIEMRDFAAEASVDHDETYPYDPKPTIKGEKGTLKRFWTNHVRITIEEVACRDHLALERTYLAYIRTASAYAQVGVAVAQLFRLHSSSTNAMTPTTLRIGNAIGATIIGIAILILLLGSGYFFKQQAGLMKGRVVGRGYELWIMVIATFAMLSIILGLLAGVNTW